MHAFWQTVYCNFCPHFSIIKLFLSPGFFNNYHCPWFSWRSFTMISLEIPFLYLSCLMCFLDLWVIWHYLLLMFQTLSLDHSLFFFKYLHYLKLYHSSWLLCPFFHSFLTLHFSLELSIDLSSSYLILPLTVCSLEICPTKVFFISVTMFLIPFWIFLRVSIFLLSLSSVLACCLHYN